MPCDQATARRLNHLHGHIVYAGEVLDNKTLLEAIQREALAYNPNGSNLRVAVGANTNLDLIVAAVSTFENMRLSASETPTDHNTIATEAALAETFQFFFQDSAAGERPIVSPPVYQAILKAAQAVEDKKLFIGGNAALMGNVMAQEGVSVMLGGPVGSQLRQLLNHPNLNFATEDSAGVEEDVHLILEYAKGQQWGDARYIYIQYISYCRAVESAFACLWRRSKRAA
jgi:ADP-dependent glucokinase